MLGLRRSQQQGDPRECSLSQAGGRGGARGGGGLTQVVGPSRPNCLQGGGGGSLLGTSGEAAPRGEAQNRACEVPKRSLMGEARRGCGRHRKQRVKDRGAGAPGRVPTTLVPSPPRYGWGGPGLQRQQQRARAPSRRQTPRPARRQSRGAGQKRKRGRRTWQSPRGAGQAPGRKSRCLFLLSQPLRVQKRNTCCSVTPLLSTYYVPNTELGAGTQLL